MDSMAKAPETRRYHDTSPFAGVPSRVSQRTEVMEPNVVAMLIDLNLLGRDGFVARYPHLQITLGRGYSDTDLLAYLARLARSQ